MVLCSGWTWKNDQCFVCSVWMVVLYCEAFGMYTVPTDTTSTATPWRIRFVMTCRFNALLWWEISVMHQWLGFPLQMFSFLVLRISWGRNNAGKDARVHQPQDTWRRFLIQQNRKIDTEMTRSKAWYVNEKWTGKTDRVSVWLRTLWRCWRLQVVSLSVCSWLLAQMRRCAKIASFHRRSLQC